jgi:type II secretory pathway component PulF
MARFPWLFDKMQVRMVEAGETGGLLVAVLGRLADYLEREYEVRLDIKRKTLYPKILLAALIFIPQVPTLVLRGVVPYLLEIWGIISMGLLVGVPTFFAFRLLLRTQAGRETWDQIKLLIPVIGGLVRKLAVGRFARTLAALYGAGVPIASALAMAGESSGNSVLEKATARMVPGVERGVPVAQAMGASGFFQPMVLGMVSTGETSGNLDVMLDKAADFYEEEGRHSIVQLVVILGVLLLLLMALIIAIKVIGFYGGFYAGATGAAGGAAGE